MNIKKQQSGFTLIELVVVIVILGILAATALPRFIDLSGEAEQAAVDGVAGAMGSAMAINYAGCSAVNNVPATGKCVAVASCAAVYGALQGGQPPGYVASGTIPNCTVTNTASTKTQIFTGIAAGVAPP